MLAQLVSNTAPVAQRIEHLTTDQKVGGSNPSGRTGNGTFLLGNVPFLFSVWLQTQG